jgi:hypothetical protein
MSSTNKSNTSHKMANNNANNVFRQKLAPSIQPSTLKPWPILLNDFGAKTIEKDYMAKFGQSSQVQLLDLIYDNVANPTAFLSQPLPVPSLVWFHGSGNLVKGTVSAGKPGLHIYIAYNPHTTNQLDAVKVVGIVHRSH